MIDCAVHTYGQSHFDTDR